MNHSLLATLSKNISRDLDFQEYGLRPRRLTRDHILKKIGFKAAAGYVGSLKKNVKSRYSLDMYNIVKDGNGNSVYVSLLTSEI